jgi:hypothetical protein
MSPVERVSGYPRSMRTRCVPAASDDGCLNALAAGARNALDLEDRERQTGYCSGHGETMLRRL